MTTKTAALAPSGTKTAEWLRLIRFALILAGALATLYVVWWKVQDGIAIDGHAYWIVTLDGTYDSVTDGNRTDDFLYTPAVAQAMSWFGALPWSVFLPVWTLLSAVALVAMAGPFTLAVLFAEPVLYELDLANVNLLIGACIVVGFRWPGAWAFVILTKVTPGIGLLWFAVRREWRSLGIALGVTAAIVAVSVVTAPGLWVDWLTLVPRAPEDAVMQPVIPLLLRLPVAAALIVWGARTDRRWVLPIACVLALPQLRYASLSILVACVPLVSLASARERSGPAH